MSSFLLKRLATALILVFVVLTLIFLAVRMVPGDPAYQLAGGDAGVTQEGIDRIRDELGLDDPLWEQYSAYLGGVLSGNLGTSFTTRQPVMQSILHRLPATLELIAVAAMIAVVIGIPLGIWAARRRGAADTFVSSATSLALAIPVYVVGAVAVLLFSVTWGVLPAGGLTPFQEDPLGHVRSLILPASSLALAFIAIVARMTRTSVIETFDRDWVRTATSLGVGRHQVFRRHVLRNSLTPVITVIGLEIGAFLGSSVIIERVFNYPGLSSLLIDGVTNRDYPVVQGVVIVIATLFILIILFVDIAYGLLDPRARQR